MKLQDIPREHDTAIIGSFEDEPAFCIVVSINPKFKDKLSSVDFVDQLKDIVNEKLEDLAGFDSRVVN